MLPAGYGVLLKKGPYKPAVVDGSSSAATGGSLFDLQPNSVVQGLDILDRTQQGSVSTGTRRLTWTELDMVAPGVTPQSGLVFGRRYFSGLTDEGRFSTGARWVTSITERLEERTTDDGLRALQHFSWNQPYNDPSYYYVENDPGSNIFTAPAFVGGHIVQNGNSYELTFKDGSKHTFADSDYGIRVAVRADSWGNETHFVYTDPLPLEQTTYGFSAKGDSDKKPKAGFGQEFSTGTLVITDSRGVSYTVTFNSLGHIVSFVDGLGHTWSMLYSTIGNVGYLTHVRAPVRQVMEANGTLVSRFTERKFTYTNYRLHQIIDDGNVVVLTNTYSTTEPNKIETQTDATGATWTFTEPVAHQTDVLGPRGFKRVYLHDNFDRMIELRQYLANFSGNPARTTDQSLYISWLFERGHGCNCGKVTKVTEPDQGTLTLVYDADLNLDEVRKIAPPAANAPAPLVWKWTHDANHRIESFTPPEGNASSNPALYTTTIARSVSAGITTKTTTVPARDWRTSASVWTDKIDSKGRLLESTGPSHDASGTPSFLGKWTYHASGSGILMPKEVYTQNATTPTYTLTWDVAGRITDVTDFSGRTWSCTYDPESRPLSWTAPLINTNQTYSHEWAYDGNGNTARIRWKYFEDDQDTTGDWIEWLYTHDAVGQMLTRSMQLDNATPAAAYATESWTYDENGNVLTATDADGYVSTATYDERDLPWELRDGVGTAEETVKTYEYNEEGRLVFIVEELDATRKVRFVNIYDPHDRLFCYKVLDEADHSKIAGVVTTLYDAGSRIQSISTMGVNASGALQLVDMKTFKYEDYHDAATEQVSFAYDLASGALLRAVLSDIEYGPTGLPVRERTDGTLIAEYEYNQHALPTKVKDTHGNYTELTYDARGSVDTEVNRYYDEAANSWLTTTRTFGHDDFGRATTITDSGTGVTSQTHTYVFDSADNVVKHTGPDGSVQTYEYRYDGQLVREDAVVAGSTVRAHQYFLTPGGRQYKVIDDRNNAVDFIYDGRGRIKQEVRPGDGSTWTNAYNHAGLITKITAPTGRTIDMTYDWRGMITGSVYKDSQGAVKRTDVFDVDIGGFVKRATKTENGLTQYVEMLNDSTGRVLSETTVVPGLPTTTVQYAYDGRGRLDTITSPYGYQHKYQYDDRNRVDNVQLHHANEGQWTVADYDYLGTGASVSRRVTGDGNQLDVTRDGFGRTTRMQTSLITDFTYGYDSGNRINVEMRAHDGAGNAYFYDNLGRLTNATRDSDNPFAEITNPGSTNFAFQREWLMDDDSHRSAVKTTPMGGATATDTYAVSGVRHHYDNITFAGQPTTTRAFDLDGRLTRHGNRYYEYDSADNLIKVRDGQTVVGEYLFDALGRRVKKTAEGWDNHLINAGPWVIEDYRRIAGGGSGWQLKGSYVHGPGIDNVVMMRHRDWVDADTDTDKVEPQNLYLHQNQLGSTIAITGPTGNVVESYRYDSYGKVKVFDANGAELAAAVAGNAFLFTGREYDWETGLYHYRSRAYDPVTGSFLQEDSLGMRDGVNVVAYVNANPINLSDPFGTSGVGETIDNIMSFINNNRALVADLLVDLMGPLEGVLDLISAVTGKDITGWIRGGMEGSPESMGWWDRACAAAGAAVKIASGGLRLLGKLKGILRKIEKIVEKAKDAAAQGGRKVMCKLTGGCFVAGTLVAMACGSFRSIEEVEAGDVVLSEVPSATPSTPGRVTRELVAASGSRTYHGALVTIQVELDGQVTRVTGTPEHPFWSVTTSMWVALGQLKPGDELAAAHGRAVITSRQVSFGSLLVYNFAVCHSDTYRVSEFALLVHNSKEKRCWVDRKLPRDPKSGLPVGDTEYAHSQLSSKISSRTGERYNSAREFDSEGRVVRDIHFTDHGGGHPNPHQHVYDRSHGNPGKRGKAKKL